MRDYLAMRPKRELLHSRPEGPSGGGRKPKPKRREYRGSPLEQKHQQELARRFGQRILNMTAEEYLASVPKAKRDQVRNELIEVLSRIADEALDYDTPNFGHSDGPPDYLAMVAPTEGDAVQYGVLGMRWGRRRSDAAIAADNARRAESGKPVTQTAKQEAAVKPGENETPQQRYARLASVAKGGGASTLDDDDLKFFNARTEAIKKVDKMFEEKPTWLRSTMNDVSRNVAKQQMQAVAGIIATKYISGRVNEALTQAQANQQKAAIKEGIRKGLEEAAKNAEISKSKNKVPIGFTAPVKK